MHVETQAVVIACIGAPYGVRGWVHVHSYTDPLDSILDYQNWMLEGTDGQLQPVEVRELRPHGKSFVAKLADIEDRDQAAALTHLKVSVSRNELPELDEDEHYWADLMGLDVRNEQNHPLGKVVDFLETGANDVIVVKDDKQEHLIPYVPDAFVLNVDLEQKTLQVRWDPEF